MNDDDEDEDEYETRRRQIIEENQAVYSGAYMDDGNSQRTLSQWRGVSRHQSKMRSFKMFKDVPTTD